MLNHGLRAIVSVVFATAFALFTRADAMMVSNPASVMAALTTTNFAQPEQIRGFSCNLPSYCSFPNTAYGRVHSRASNRFYYESCRCGFGNNDLECVPIISCYAEGGRCRGSCSPQSGFYSHPPAN
jgi:hypothetical protein